MEVGRDGICGIWIQVRVVKVGEKGMVLSENVNPIRIFESSPSLRNLKRKASEMSLKKKWSLEDFKQSTNVRLETVTHQIRFVHIILHRSFKTCSEGGSRRIRKA